jgi:sialate O-acetylesterase
MDVARITQRIVSCLLPLLAAGNSPGFEVTSGLVDHQVVQRRADGTATVSVKGRSERTGMLRVRVTRGDHGLRVAGFADRELTRIGSGEWTARLDGLPTGGPYRVEFAVGSGGDEETAAVEDILVGDLWILAGQSNMVGRAELKDVEQPDERIHVLKPKSGDWDLAKEPVHERRERNDMVIGAGLGLPFAKEMVRRTRVPIGLIPTAVGGTSLWQWDPALKTKGRESLYGNMLLQFEEAGGRVRGMLWYQGEADTRSDRVAQYMERFRNFVAAVRSDLRSPDLPIYTTQLSRYVITPTDRTDGTWSAMREVQRQAARRIQGVHVVSGIDLGLVDLIHVDTEGLKTLGMRFAKQVCGDLYSDQRACADLKPGPDVESVRWEGPFRLRVKFSGVNGSLRAPGRVLGFDVKDGNENHRPLVFRAEISESSDEVVLSLVRREEVPDPAFLWYGYGMDPIANLVDAEGLAAPGFGPIRLPARPAVP